MVVPTSADSDQAISWVSGEYRHDIHDELMEGMNAMTVNVEWCQRSPCVSTRRLLRNESSSSVITESSPEPNVETHSQRIHRLKQPSYSIARMNDGLTFLLMECCARTPLARALRDKIDIRCMSTLTLEDLDGLEIEDGWRAKVLSTPHKNMPTADVNYVKRELDLSFGADACMDASPRGSYTIALVEPESHEYASFIAFRAFAVVSHTHESKMVFVYVDHIFTKQNHRRKNLGRRMIELMKRACVPMCRLYRVPTMHVVTQSSFDALTFWSKFMVSSSDACLILMKLIQMSESQDDSGPNRRTGRFKIKLFSDVIDMMMEVPVV
jgi:GNAT superfamily N-acetyltransferase